MKKAVGLVELLLIIIIAIVVYFAFVGHGNKRPNPVEEVKNVQYEQQLIDEKIDNIEDLKLLREHIEKERVDSEEF